MLIAFQPIKCTLHRYIANNNLASWLWEQNYRLPFGHISLVSYLYVSIKNSHRKLVNLVLLISLYSIHQCRLYSHVTRSVFSLFTCLVSISLCIFYIDFYIYQYCKWTAIQMAYQHLDLGSIIFPF